MYPRGAILSRRSDSCRQSHRAWQARFYWVVEMPPEPLAWRAFGGYPVVDRSPFGWLLRIGSLRSELRGPTVLTQNSQGANGVLPQPSIAAPRLAHRLGCQKSLDKSIRAEISACCFPYSQPPRPVHRAPSCPPRHTPSTRPGDRQRGESTPPGARWRDARRGTHRAA